MKTLTVTLTEFAALIGRSLPTVQTMVRDGMPTLGKRGREHRVEVTPAVQWVIRQIEARIEDEVDSAVGNPELVHARTRKVKTETQALELKLARQRGELVSRDQVILEGQTIVKGWRAKILALPRQLVLHGVIGPETESAVARQLRDLLTEISRWKTVADVEKAAADAA